MGNHKTYFNARYHLIALAAIGLVFLFIYIWQFSGIKPIFTSPDETANYYFVKLLSEQNQLKVFEPLATVSEGLIHPRSTAVVNGYIVPGSFAGIILLYGIIAKITGSWIILYLTPIFAVVGVLFFYLLIKEIFSSRVAFISSLLFFFHPSFWYYASRGMFHNVLFLVLLIVGLYFLIRAFRVKSNLLYLFSGLFIGLSLTVRTSEFLWVMVMVTILFLINRRHLDLRKLLVFIILVGVSFASVFYFNNLLYGSPFSFAYSQSPVDTSSLETISQTLFYKVRQLIFPFGFSILHTGQAVLQYFIVIFSWFFLLFIVGFTLFVKQVIQRKMTRAQVAYGVIFFLVSIWLFLYYGSWEFYEYIDRTRIILGSSYIRYWLPVYVFGLPFVVIGVINLANLFKKRIVRYVFPYALVILVAFFSIQTVLLDHLQGLAQLRGYAKENIEKKNIVLQHTKPDAVIIAGFADKLFFPERKVIVSLPSDREQANRILTNLAAIVPMYYYYVPSDINAEETVNQFSDLHIELQAVTSVTRGEILYRLKR